MSTQPSAQSTLEQRISVLYKQLFLLKLYYSESIVPFDAGALAQAAQVLEECAAASQELGGAFAQSVQEIQECARDLREEDRAELKEAEYNFNALFVGPTRLVASPVASSYVEDDKSAFSTETLKVRHAYALQGFECQAKNSFPDDHLAYELEFMLRLLESGEDSDLQALASFVQERVDPWIGQHLACLDEHATTGITKGFARLLGITIKELDEFVGQLG